MLSGSYEGRGVGVGTLAVLAKADALTSTVSKYLPRRLKGVPGCREDLAWHYAGGSSVP